jgi:hypothetical protein
MSPFLRTRRRDKVDLGMPSWEEPTVTGRVHEAAQLEND